MPVRPLPWFTGIKAAGWRNWHISADLILKLAFLVVTFAMLFAIRDRTAASRRTPSYALRGRRSIPFGCGSPGSAVRAGAANGSPSESREPCHAGRRFFSTYQADAGIGSL